MDLFNFIIALMALFMVTNPVMGKHGCAKCKDSPGASQPPGTLFCDYHETLQHFAVKKCGKDGCVQVETECKGDNNLCFTYPSPHCSSKEKACAGCNEFYNHCKDYYWATCPNESACDKTCRRDTCDMEGGRCAQNCNMSICRHLD
ncbi:hypothetical protein T440DRAFT_466478 [Plenodomus tracheiphilus IPT5]|uniref:Uncharacterized protein n=1 Tax=Plenodomus tracheiphilus IPT5 TaxID=1408161 RepID=A0A6A7BC19_9PLEO|nr:hypothetical protein T440DRAFT_466478 [Plenodomus tracheiphilus IPT5]